MLSSPLCRSSDPPPPVQLIDGRLAFSVWRILDVWQQGSGQQFLVDWERYGLEERSWVSLSLILDPSLITDFFRSHCRFEADRPPGGLP